MSAVLEAPKLDHVIAKYIELRDRKEKINADAKAQVEQIEVHMKHIEAWLHQKLNESGAESFRTEFGTAFKAVKDFCSVADKQAVIQYVKENDAFNLLTISVSKTAVKEYIDEHQVPPPGVNYVMQEQIQVRRGK